jgi:hypothetical protein
VASDRSNDLSVIFHAESGDIEVNQTALIPWAAKETNHGAVFGRWPDVPDWHQGLEVTLAGSDRLRAPVAVWAGTYPPLELKI